jgi:hypothetical protein
VVFDGSSAQSVTFQSPGAANSRFYDVLIGNSSGVNFNTSVYNSNDLDLTGVLSVAAATTLDIINAFYLRSGATMNNGGTVNAGTCPVQDGTVTGNAVNCIG